ncbi:clustered mitochondria protein homolog [Schistocerca gregaria]|uniref:clustered mitochondria protein homolog n=1 Tax=Schistocerca gregaria TaxID=7010 RepID=UPI00211EA6D1|nr:clustered mitochondria protein homolog [Schistocerca gregaria]
MTVDINNAELTKMALQRDKKEVELVVTSPSSEQIKFSISLDQTVHDIKMTLMDNPSTCCITCYHLEYLNEPIEDERLGIREFLQENKNTLLMIQDLYTYVDSRHHVQRLYELLEPIERPSALVSSSRYPHAEQEEDWLENFDYYEKPYQEAPLGLFYHKDYMTDADVGALLCLKQLRYSSFNPPTGNRRLNGDFFYLDVVTLESKEAVIVASPSGFYVSKCDRDHFDPTPADEPHHSKLLSDCLSFLSCSFKKNFQQRINYQLNSSIYEIAAPSFPCNPWLAPRSSRSYDIQRAEKDLLLNSVIEFGANNKYRSWNDEFQSALDMPVGTVQEIIDRDYTLQRIHCDFVEVATQGAVAIVEGKVQAINVYDSQINRAYIYSDIFYSQAVDPVGMCDDETFSKVINVNLLCLKNFYSVDPPDLRSLNMAIIDYRGFRLVAQTIIPDIFEGLLAGEEVVTYGKLEAIHCDPEFHRRLGQVAAQFHLREHQVSVRVGDEPSPVYKLWTSCDVKGIVDKNNRYYLIDLAYMLPRDYNYRNSAYSNAVYRPELIQQYIYSHGVPSSDKQSAADNESDASKQAEGDSKASAQNGHEKLVFPDYRFNMDLYVNNVNLEDSQEELDKDVELNKDIGEYLMAKAIALAIAACNHSTNIQGGLYPIKEILHECGVNLRYLGYLTNLAASKAPAHVNALVSEMIVRSAKTLFRRFIRSAPENQLACRTAEFLNALFQRPSEAELSNISSDVSPQPFTADSAPSRAALWTQIYRLVKSKYRYDLPVPVDETFFITANLRSFCLSCGIALRARSYNFEDAEHIFFSEDIHQLLPVVKHVSPVSGYGDSILSFSEKASRTDHQLAYNLLQEVHFIFHQIYGPVHPLTAHYFLQLSNLAYSSDKRECAYEYSKRAVQICEQVNGLDHAITACAYDSLARISLSLSKHEEALNYSRRALYLKLINTGANYLHYARMYSELIFLLSELQKFDSASRVLHNLLECMGRRLGGPPLDDRSFALPFTADAKHTSIYLNLANVYHMMATVEHKKGNYAKALSYEMKNYNILTSVGLKETDADVLYANAWLTALTKKAVSAGKGRPLTKDDKLGERQTQSESSNVAQTGRRNRKKNKTKK